ncbi:MAG: tetratricopeptide repeat protein, partial [Ktedonobacteraceae bacterium]
MPFPPVEVFYSFADGDAPLLQQLEHHLSVLRREGQITTWHKRHITAGSDWQMELDQRLNTASLILLLISPDFLASDYQYGVELQQAMLRHAENEARVIPIVLRPCDWEGAPFARLQMVPRNGKAITTWRNRDEAFTEIAKEIRVALQTIQQLAISTPRSSLPKIWQVPYARNPFFTGREHALEHLHAQLQQKTTAAIGQTQSISGLGGIGKTQLAVEYAYRYLEEYQCVLWAHAQSVETLNSSFTEIARLLKLPEKDEQEQAITMQAVTHWLQRQQGWLLILDNADSPALLPDFLPPTVGGHLLITTRAADVSAHITGLAHPLMVQTFSDEQGALFLLHRSGLLALDATFDQTETQVQHLALSIAHELGGLPLALDQAGAYLSATGSSLASYQQIYQQRYAQLLNERRSTEHPEPVATTWNLSFEQIERQNPAAADLLRMLAFLAPEAIPEAILTKGAEGLGPALAPVVVDAYLLNEAIEGLRRYSLIDRDPSTQTLTVHRLLQTVLRDTLSKEAQQQWMHCAIAAVEAAYPGSDVAHWAAYERLLPHALVCAIWIEHLPTVKPVAVRLLEQAGYYLYARGRYREAEPLYERALAIYEQHLGWRHHRTAGSLNHLAALYQYQGKYEEAEPLLQRALAIYEQQLGAYHLKTAQSLNQLAALYSNQGKYEEAEPLLQRALAIYEQQLGETHP